MMEVIIEAPRSRPRASSACLFGVVVVLAIALSSCVPEGKRPFMMVQLCVADDRGLSAFTSLMQSISSEEGMRFVDASETTRRSYDLYQQQDPRFRFTTPVVHFGILGPDTMGLSAGNLGLKRYQMAIAFSEGRHPQEARGFADRTVSKLRKYWKVDVVPPGVGVLPMEVCGGKDGDSE